MTFYEGQMISVNNNKEIDELRKELEDYNSNYYLADGPSSTHSACVIIRKRLSYNFLGLLNK